jgi:hypothetical protein
MDRCDKDLFAGTLEAYGRGGLLSAMEVIDRNFPRTYREVEEAVSRGSGIPLKFLSLTGGSEK